MRPFTHRAFRTIALVAALASVGCSGTLNEPQGSQYRIRLVNPTALAGATPLRPIADTLRFELVDREGARVRQWTAWRDSTSTGWLDAFDGVGWNRRRIIRSSDSTGILRLRWMPAHGASQTLALHTSDPDNALILFSRPFALTAQAVPVVPGAADTVVTSGSESVCWLAAGRVGCTAPGVPGSGPRWLTFSAAVHSISSTINGSCALLVDGNTACWQGAGPTTVVRNDPKHPPFIEFRNSVGRTATGELWKGVFASEWGTAYEFENRVWQKISSDSTIVRLLDDENGLFSCGITASQAVMCSVGRRTVPVFPGDPFASTPFQLLRNAADSSVIRATGGFTSVDGVLMYDGSNITNLAVLRTVSGSGARVTLRSNDGGSFYGDVRADSTLQGADASVRSCVRELDPQCAPGSSWRSVSSGGRLARVHLNVIEVGHRVTCGVRTVIVCQAYIAGGARQIPSLISTDTIRLAP
jgi:hypothetical protein